MTALKKRLGQHLLVDPWIIAHVLEVLQPNPEDTWVEIGPGQGAITMPLVKQVRHLYAVEIDRDMVRYLQTHVPASNLTLYTQDALTFDLTTLPRCRLVGNLPYYITTPLLFHFVRHRAQLIDWYCLVQREVALRLTAVPRQKHYGRLSVMMQYHCHIDDVLAVPADAFQPPPQVASTLVRFHPHQIHQAQDENLLAWLVQRAFGQRRKMLRQVFKHVFDPEHLLACDLSPQDRAEALSVADFVRLSDHLTQQGWQPS